MKTFPAGLQAHLDSGATTLCTCWRVARKDGALFGFTDHDRSLSFGGVTYAPDSGFSTTEAVNNLGLSADAAEIDGALSSDVITEDDIALGLWDNATIEVYRVNWSDVSQRVIIRKGALGEVSRGDIDFTAEVRSLAAILSQETGRTYQRTCDAVVGDHRCGVDLTRAKYQGAGVILSAIDDRIMTVSGLEAFEESWFFLGLLTWSSGGNLGVTAKLSAHLIRRDGTVMLHLWERADRPIAIGDAFTITVGCANTFDECKSSKFDNAANFRGFPHIPGNDFALSVAKTSANSNDGGSFFHD